MFLSNSFFLLSFYFADIRRYCQTFVEVLTRAVLCILCPTNFYLHKPQRNNNINLIHYSNLRLCVLKQTHTRKKSFSSNFQNPKFAITVCCCSVTKWSESSIVDRPERWIVTIPLSDQWLATSGNHWKTIATNGFGDQKPLKNHC